MMTGKRNIWLWSLIFVFLASCTKMCGKSRSEMNPEEVVEAYLNISLNMKVVEQKEDLLKLTTGTLKSAILQSDNETLQKAFIDKTYILETYSVVERRDRTPRETEITFRLEYRDLGDDATAKADDAPKIITENTVSVVREDKAWFIKDVLGKKTSIDFPVTGDIIKPLN
jgi:hypothetical protein